MWGQPRSAVQPQSQTGLGGWGSRCSMTDDEYREYLNALAAKYLRVGDLAHHFHGPMGELGYELVRLSSTARLPKAVGERTQTRHSLPLSPTHSKTPT